MKIAELQDLNSEELAQKLQGFKRELFDLGMQRAEGKLTQAHRMQRARRDVARVLTILKQKQKPVTAGGKS